MPGGVRKLLLRFLINKSSIHHPIWGSHQMTGFICELVLATGVGKLICFDSIVADGLDSCLITMALQTRKLVY